MVLEKGKGKGQRAKGMAQDKEQRAKGPWVFTFAPFLRRHKQRRGGAFATIHQNRGMAQKRLHDSFVATVSGNVQGRSARVFVWFVRIDATVLQGCVYGQMKPSLCRFPQLRGSSQILATGEGEDAGEQKGKKG
jgi:hypothetical protein